MKNLRGWWILPTSFRFGPHMSTDYIKEKFSPDGRYKLVVKTVTTGENTWSYLVEYPAHRINQESIPD